MIHLYDRVAVNGGIYQVHRREADVCEVGSVIDGDDRAIDIQVTGDALEVGLEEKARGKESVVHINGGACEKILDSNGADIKVHVDVGVGAGLVVGELDSGGGDVPCSRGCGDGGGQEGKSDGGERLHFDG